MKKYKTGLLFIFLVLTRLNLFSQFVNEYSPVYMSKSPTFTENGDIKFYLKINEVPDSTAFTPADITFSKLIPIISIGKNSYQLNPIIPSVDNNIAEYLLSKDAIPQNETSLNKLKWNEIKYSYEFQLKSLSQNTQAFTFDNPFYTTKTVSNKLSVKSIYKNSGEDVCYAEVRAINDGVLLKNGSTKLKIDSKDQSHVAQLDKNMIINSDKFYQVKLRVNKDIVLNLNELYYLEINASKDDSKYASYLGPHPLSLRQSYYVTSISGNKVFGNNEGKLRAITSLNGNSLNLVFKDPVLNIGQLPTIAGQKISENNFEFTIPSNNSGFKYGKFEIAFSGKSIDGINYLEEKPKKFEFQKLKNSVENLELKQDSSGINVTANILAKSSASDVVLFIDGNKITNMNKVDGEETIYEIKFDLRDKILLKYITKDTKKVDITISVDGFLTETIFTFPVKVFDTSKAVNDLSSIKGGNSKKREQIKTYLIENEFQGNLDSTVASIFDQLKKDKKDRNWNNTWDGLNKVVPTIFGALLMIL